MGTYCNKTGTNGDNSEGTCLAQVAVGGECSLNTKGSPCAGTALCYNGSGLVNPTYGICVASNSYANGATFKYPPEAFFLAASVGATLCQSMIAVPVPNATGYTYNTVRWSQARAYLESAPPQLFPRTSPGHVRRIRRLVQGRLPLCLMFL